MSKRVLAVIGFSLLLAGCRQSSPDPAISIAEVWSRPVMVAHESRANLGSDSAMAAGSHSGMNGVVYLTLKNDGGSADRLLRAQTEVCTVTEIHRTMMKGDRMSMQHITGGIEIPAHGSVQLKPKDYHIMLMGLKRSLAVDDSFAVQLEFEKSGVKTVFSKVREP